MTVHIFNRDYRLMTDESKEYTDRLAAELNRKMADLLSSKATLSVQDAAALICLECYDELTKARKNIENIRTQIKTYVDEANAARQEAEEAKNDAMEFAERAVQLEKELKLRKSFEPKNEKISASDIISRDISDALENKSPYGYGKK